MKVEVKTVSKVVKQDRVKPIKNTIKYAKMYRPQPRGNQRNWNKMKSQQLGSEFIMQNRYYFVCGSFDQYSAYCPNNHGKR